MMLYVCFMDVLHCHVFFLENTSTLEHSVTMNNLGHEAMISCDCILKRWSLKCYKCWA